MKRILSIAILIATAALCVQCAQGQKKVEAPQASGDQPTWSGRMQQLNSTISDLLPYVFDEKRFNDPQNFQVIIQKTKSLADLAHTLDGKTMGAVNTPNSDPALGFFAGQFKEDLNRAYESLTSEHRVYARSVLKTSISYCISCHTRSDAGPKFGLVTDNSFVTGLLPLERARYFTATRQFEPALKEFVGILENPDTGKLRPFDIEKAARNALAITVRVKKDPDASLRIAKDVVSKSATPLFVRSDAETWVTSIQAWKKELNKQYNNEPALLNKIKDLIRQAEKSQRYPADMKGDIYHLRATSLIHEYFNRFPNPKNPAEIFYLAGVSYEALKDLGFWTLHEMYFERCVRSAPHTPIAHKCYESFEQSVLLGYSGSAGLFLPASVSKQLDELRGLATPM